MRQNDLFFDFPCRTITPVHEMIHGLSRRLDALQRYNQYIANAETFGAVQSFWTKVKQQEQDNIVELKHQQSISSLVISKNILQ